MTNTTEIKIYSPKKLIEVALPLDDINIASAREKSIRHGHPSTLHLWWARRPLATARAIIFAQMVNDPGYQQDGGFKYGVNKKEAEIKREKLFQIIRDLVKWENTDNEEVLNRAREAIKDSWRETCHLNRKHPQAVELFNPEKLPAFHDPFAGGGAIPLEAQRLGLESYASDLNPVAVLINKAMIEIPPKFSGQVPVGPIPDGEKQQNLVEDWQGAKGLAEDVRRYGHWMREEAFKKIGHLYPKIKITDQMVLERPDLKPYIGEKLTVISWIWTRIVKSPNPIFSSCDIPLASTFVLSSKKDKYAWVEPVIDKQSFKFVIHNTVPPIDSKKGTKLGRGANFNCLFSNTIVDSKYVYSQALNGKMSQRLMAIVVEAKNKRLYLNPSSEHEKLASDITFEWSPSVKMPDNPRWFSPPMYGMKSYGELFTNRQLATLGVFSDLVDNVRNKVLEDSQKSFVKSDKKRLTEGGRGSIAYADALATYMGINISKSTRFITQLSFWRADEGKLSRAFGRQAIAMTWDFAETNPFSSTGGDIAGLAKGTADVLLKSNSSIEGFAEQLDAQTQTVSMLKVVSTDPPYYDNIGYADLSDYFYVWLRKTLKSIHPQLFSTLEVPKAEELVATPYRHGSKSQAESFFLTGMQEAMTNLSKQSHPAFPISIYYAFKQSETKETGTSNTGWETFLEAVIQSGLEIVGTWPVRTEGATRMNSMGTNALASSIVLVCKKRNITATYISRRDFQRELREQMPEALDAMIGGETGRAPIAPVDLAQAAIGPGMAIYSKYSAVLNSDASKLSVHEALILINKAITDYLNPNSGNFDADTLFCDDWFSQYGWSEGLFGEADTLARAKGTSVEGVQSAGVIESGGGKVRLLKWTEYPTDWDPKTDARTPIWEACHQMIRVLNQQGESEAGALLAKMPERGEPIRQLAYHLYTLCERKKWAEEARAYNELIGSWHAIVAASHETGHRGEQAGLDF